jgi:hypothetical protein
VWWESRVVVLQALCLSVIMSKMDEAKKIVRAMLDKLIGHGGIGGARPCAIGACSCAGLA